tara:strand:+ start:53072 stop:54235 length:1164 start_codon:yes stop_codon:yes gene_type:complete
LKVALISHLFPTELHPIQGKFIKDQAELIQSSDATTNVSVFVLTPTPIPFTKRAVESKSTFETSGDLPERVHYLSIPKKKLPFITQFSLVKIFKRILKDQSFDLIHVHFLYPGGLVLPLLKKRGVKTAITIHGGDWYRIIHLPFFKRMVEKALTSADQIFVVGPQLKKDISIYFPALSFKIFQINNFIDEKIYTLPSKSDKIQAKERMGWDVDKKHFLCIANNRPEKGLDILSNAFSDKNSQFEDIKVHIVGNMNDSFKEFEFPFIPCFDIHPAMPPSKLIDYYYAADAYIFPSRKEGFGLSLIEATATGLPVVATPAGIASDFVSDKTGILCSDFAPSTLRDSISKLEQTLTTYDSEEIRALTIKNFGSQAFLSKLITRYKNIIYD